MHGVWLILVMGAAVSALGLFRLRQYAQMSAWQQAEGVLTSVEPGYGEERIRYSSIYYGFPVATYEYSVADTKYCGTRISLETKNIWLPLEEVQNASWAHWRVGNTVAVYFNPSEPEESVLVSALQPRRRSHHMALALGGTLVILVGLGVAALGT